MKPDSSTQPPQAPDAARLNAQLLAAVHAAGVGLSTLEVATGRVEMDDTFRALWGIAPGVEITPAVIQARLHPDDVGVAYAAQQQAFAPGSGGRYQARFRIVHGQTGQVRWLSLSGQLQRAPGQPDLLVGLAQDVTAAKASEDRLQLLDALGEATRTTSRPDEVMAVTTQLLGEHLHATRCAYADVESDSNAFTIRSDWTAPGVRSTAGAYSLDRFGPKATLDLRRDVTLVVRDVDRELTAGGDAMFREIGIQAIVCCPLVRDGKLVAMMAVHQATARDWTADEISLVAAVAERSWAHIERVRAADELREQDRRKDEFLAILAHELRNPLAPIRTGLQVLKLAPDGPGGTRIREMMDRQLGHMVRLIDDLLDVSRISRGKLELKLERVRLQDVLDHALESSRPLVDAAQHALSVRVPERPVWLQGDLTRLAQVVSNLLNNSAKYTPQHGHLRLTAEVEGDFAVIRVVDDGNGITAELLPEVFNLFTQGMRPVDRGQSGLGIGLSLTRELVQMHGGTVEAQSPGAGQGSTFTVRLPLLAAEPAPEPAARGRPGAASRKRILVVDDNEDAAEMLAAMLDLYGHETRIAHDGPRALAAAADFAPEIIFLDIGMPGMDGHEVARRLRADARFRDTVLVALTGWGSTEDVRRTQEAGFDFHFTKPVEVSKIADLLASLSEKPALGRRR